MRDKAMTGEMESHRTEVGSTSTNSVRKMITILGALDIPVCAFEATAG